MDGSQISAGPGINLLDSEIIAIEKVVEKLNERVGTRGDLEGYRKEIVGRFEEIGLQVHVAVRGDETEIMLGNAPAFWDITIEDHCERKPFDHERQRHEVINDILGIGGGGIVLN